MSIKTQIKKELRKIERYQVTHRSGFERAGAIFLTAATLFSLTELGGHSEQKRVARTDVVAPPNVVLGPAEKNETVRMPIKFDDGLRSVATTGE